MTDIESLFIKLAKLNYPQSMVAVKGEIPGIAFFPGGKGTFDTELSLQDKPIMVLGQDFDSEKNFQIAVKTQQENIDKNPTWRNLRHLLNKAGIQPEDCFFTNAIMGVRAGIISVGKSPAFQDAAFIKECQEFFLDQIALQKPKLILVLGKSVAHFLSFTSSQLENWRNAKSIKSIDDTGNQVKENVLFANGVRANVVLLTHPCFRPTNIHRRKFGELKGSDAEISMVQSLL